MFLFLDKEDVASKEDIVTWPSHTIGRPLRWERCEERLCSQVYKISIKRSNHVGNDRAEVHHGPSWEGLKSTGHAPFWGG